MTAVQPSVIRDAALTPSGRLKVEWAKAHMPVLNVIREEFEREKPFAGRRVAICCHLEAKTAYLATVIQAGGAEVAITGSNPLSTQDDVAAALAETGVSVYAWHGATTEEYFHHLNLALDVEPDLLLDDGGDMTNLLHTERKALAGRLLGGTEETTTGVIRLRAMEADGVLAFPMIAVNDAYSKFLFDNRYGTGQSTWDGIMRNTNVVIAGKRVVVGGYGWCGKGVAMRAKGLGAQVIVCEVDPIRAIEAHMDGFRVMPAIEAARLGDIFVTVTGCKGVFEKAHLAVMKDGAILANAGHFDVEIDKAALEEMASEKRQARDNVTAYHLPDGRRLYLLAEGRLVNLAAGDGHPAEIMDMSFATQALTLRYIAERHDELRNKVYPVDGAIDRRVAELKLLAEGLEIDSLTDEQQRYLHSWKVD